MLLQGRKARSRAQHVDLTGRFQRSWPPLTRANAASLQAVALGSARAGRPAIIQIGEPLGGCLAAGRQRLKQVDHALLERWVGVAVLDDEPGRRVGVRPVTTDDEPPTTFRRFGEPCLIVLIDIYGFPADEPVVQA